MPPAIPNLALLNEPALPTHDYEPLVGGTGKEIYYRQARYAVADLLGEHSDIEHYVHFDSLRGVIIDFGINGVAFSLKQTTPAPDQVVPDFQVIIGKDVLYHGRALVRYCRVESNTSTTVGVVLLDGILDTDAMVMAKNRALAAKTAALLSQTLEAGVSQQYKEAMADLVLLLSYYRKLLDSQEQSILSLSDPDVRERAEKEVLDIAITQFGSQYDCYRKRCNDLTGGLRAPMKTAYRQYTEAVLHPYVVSAPDVHHAFHKPLGYPGDYILMLYLYDPQPYGNSLFDKLIHEVVVREEPMAEGVRKRKDFLREQIRLSIDSTQGSAELPRRILSVACGPAREIVEFVQENLASCCPVVFTLVDQDQRSLTHANSSLSRLLIPGATNITVKYMYMGFKQMIAQLDAFDSLPQQDLIYAAGLFDYIKTPTARKLVQRLFQKLGCGGKLIIGNFRSPNDAMWGLEYLVDWRLIYRTRDDMQTISDVINAPHEVELTCDESGYTYMLIITRS
jgi:SAM-dependent methyltransferase